jgi:hypothetical protein
MKLYRIEAGTLGNVYHPKINGGVIRKWKVRKQLNFDVHEMIFDPVASANGRLKKLSNWSQMQARKGFAGFERDGYLLVVWYNDVNVLC